MRSPSTATANAIVGRSTRPAWLVQIGWTTPTRITSGAALTWNGNTWAAADVQVTNLRWGQTGIVSATLRLGNASAQWSTLVLNEGFSGVLISLWAYDQAATATGDPIAVFAGEGGSFSLDVDTVVVQLASRRTRALKSPRFRIIGANGFSNLPVAGTSFQWGNDRYILQRGR